MKIRSILTKLEHEVTEEQWLSMKKRGDTRKYKIVNTGAAKKAPAEVIKSDFETKLEQADAHFKKEEYEDALAIYTDLQAIKSTPFIKKRLKEIKEKTK